MTKIISRSAWGARPATNRTTIARSRRRTFVVHYDGNVPITRTGNSVPQAIQNFHMDSNGWADAGYNFAIDQAGNIFELRGWDTLGAHAGSTGNVEGIGVQVHIGGSQEPSPAALAALVWLKGEADRLMGRTLDWRNHGDYMSTSCAGEPLRRWLKAGRPLEQPVSVSPPSQTATPRYVRPVAHRVTAAYRIPGKWQAGHHTGIDFGCPIGSPIYAVADGDVRDRGSLMGADYGRVVTVNEDDSSGGPGAGSDWHYCHLSHVMVKPGQRVTAGQIIGFSGSTGRSTGPHLHLERRPRMGGYGTDRDPVLWPAAPAKPVSPTPHAIPEEDPMPELRESRFTIHHAGLDFQASKDHPAIGTDVIGPIVYDASATVTAPEGAKLTTRWAVLNRKTGEWAHRTDPVEHAGHRAHAASGMLHTGGESEISIFLDVWSDAPGEISVVQSAGFWKKG